MTPCHATMAQGVKVKAIPIHVWKAWLARLMARALISSSAFVKLTSLCYV
ncbi:MAG: hypothetical protein GFH27_549397n5 [Chloroflexi bacterium AL-W]|nr:hypothetical protein [Chloroflexi bacterium AL-W]